MDLRLKQAPVIWLTGFMGSGKSTTGKLLAKKLGWQFIDLDAEIERAACKPIPEIFEQQGEDAFRDLEHAQLRLQAHNSRRGAACIVALGGGAFVAPRNRNVIEDCGVALWLDPPLPILWERVSGNDKRPLAKDPEAFKTLYDARRSSYALAPYCISATTSDAAVVEILALNLL